MGVCSGPNNAGQLGQVAQQPKRTHWPNPLGRTELQSGPHSSDHEIRQVTVQRTGSGPCNLEVVPYQVRSL